MLTPWTKAAKMLFSCERYLHQAGKNCILLASYYVLMTKWEGWMGKYLARGHGVWIKRSEVRAP